MKLFAIFFLGAKALKVRKGKNEMKNFHYLQYKEVLQAYKESPAETGLGLRKKPKKPKKNKGSSR